MKRKPEKRLKKRGHLKLKEKERRSNLNCTVLIEEKNRECQHGCLFFLFLDACLYVIKR